MHLPPAVARYYDAVDGGRFAEVLEIVSDRVTFAIPRTGAPETSVRATWRGRHGVEAMFAARGPLPIRHSPLLALSRGGDWLIEGEARSVPGDVALSHFMVSIRLDADGAIEQYLAYASPPPDPAVWLAGLRAAESDTAIAGADEPVARWLAALDSGADADLLDADAAVSIPVVAGDAAEGAGERQEWRGADEIRARLGTWSCSGLRHRPTLSCTSGRVTLVQGALERDGAAVGVFLARVVVSPAGRIERHLGWWGIGPFAPA